MLGDGFNADGEMHRSSSLDMMGASWSPVKDKLAFVAMPELKGWGGRISQAVLTYASAVGRRVGLEELGVLIAEAEGREQPYRNTTLSMWMGEKSEPPIRAFEAMAEVFGCDPWWIVWGVGRPPSNVALDRFVPIPRAAEKKGAKKKRAK